jgi:predicted ATPase/DNA-binding XRE family transcriptional regulator
LTEVSFGEWLKRQRMGRGWTRGQLAHQVGCAVITLRKIEAEERHPSAQIVERLAEIFNIPKSEQSSFLKYARGDWSQVPSNSIEETPWHAPTSPRTNLPAPITSFIGRENEQKEVADLLAKHRLVTLIGPPGIGKTRLSIETARQLLADFPDGIFFVALAPLDDSTLIAYTTLQVLGYVESRKFSADKQLIQGIGDKYMLIVLDNCEHLIKDAAAFASGLLSACPHLKIIATSREALRVTGEWLYAVPTLDVPKTGSSIDMENVARFPALMLFAERAHAVRSDFTLNTDNLGPVASICARLDGLPLAIELISAQLRLHSPQSLLERLSNQLVLSTEGARNAPARQTSLSHAIDWSYDSLTPDEQRLFTYLSACSGGFTLSTAEAIFSQHFTETSISDLITSLLDKSLLQRSSSLDEEVRFTMLVTIQQFAMDRLRQTGDEADVRNWHLSYFLDFAERAEKQIHGSDQLKWIDWVEDELDNFRAALSWCISDQKTDSALILLTSLSEAWGRRDHFHEIHNSFNAIRLLPGIMDYPLLYARLLNHISTPLWVLGDYDYARSLLEESQAILIKLGGVGELDLAMNLCWLGMVGRMSEADHQAAQPFYARSLELYQKHGDSWGMAFVMFNLGHLAAERNEDRSALSLFEQSMDIFRRLGDKWGIARVSQMQGTLFLKQGNFEQAYFFLNQHLVIDEEWQFKQGMTMALFNMGDFYRYQGDYGQSEFFYKKMLDICRQHDLKMDESLAYYALGMIALHRNEYERADQYFKDYYSIHRNIVKKWATIDLLYALAAIAAGTNRFEDAARFYGAAQALLESSKYPYSSFDLAEFERHIRIAQEQLGGTKFEDLVSEGHAMTMEQAVKYALEEFVR